MADGVGGTDYAKQKCQGSKYPDRCEAYVEQCVAQDESGQRDNFVLKGEGGKKFGPFPSLDRCIAFAKFAANAAAPASTESAEVAEKMVPPSRSEAKAEPQPQPKSGPKKTATPEVVKVRGCRLSHHSPGGDGKLPGWIDKGPEHQKFCINMQKVKGRKKLKDSIETAKLRVEASALGAVMKDRCGAKSFRTQFQDSDEWNSISGGTLTHKRVIKIRAADSEEIHTLDFSEDTSWTMTYLQIPQGDELCIHGFMEWSNLTCPGEPKKELICE